MERDQVITVKPAKMSFNDHIIDEMNNFNGFLIDCEVEPVFHKIT